MKSTTKLAIGSDHAGYELKEALAAHLRAHGYDVRDCGTHSKESVDYPTIAYTVARQVASGECAIGVIVDGAGIGSAMAANKVRGVRAAACTNEALARNAREHNDANVLTLGAGQSTLEAARWIVDVFLSSRCTVDRHLRRVQLIKDIEMNRLEERPAGPPHPPSPSPRTPSAPDRLDLSVQDMQRVMQKVRQILAQSGKRPDMGLGLRIPPRELGKLIDHTLLKPEASKEDIERLCREAIEHGFYSVCVNSGYARQTKNLLRGSDVKLCTVVGFPLGAQAPDIKALEARKAIREGAQEIDMVINVGALKSGDDALVLEDLLGVVKACRDGRALCKVILETALLTDEEKVRACQLAMRAGTDFVKTSTGFGPGGATVQDVSLMSSVVAPKRLGVKASGGIRCYADAIKMIEAGATRIGASSSVRILEEAAAAAGGQPVSESKSKGAS